MSQLQLTEIAVEAIHERLLLSLPDWIDTVNDDVTDDHMIDRPALTLDYVPTLATLNEFPCVGIMHGRSTIEDDNGWSATGKHEIGVVTFLQETDQEALARKLRRYALAITNTILEDRDLGDGPGVPWGTGLIAVDYGPTLTEVEGSRGFMSWVATTIWVKLDEE